MCTPALGFLLTDLGFLECTHASHTERAVGIRESDGSWNSKRAAAYPARLNAILAKAMSQLATPVATRATTSPSPGEAPQSVPPPPPPPPPPPVTQEHPTPQLPPQPIRPAAPQLPEPPIQPPAAATTQPSAASTAAPPNLVSSRTRSKTRSMGAALAAMCLEDNDADGIILIVRSSAKASAEPRSHAEAMRDDPRAGAPPNCASSTTNATMIPSSSSTAQLQRALTPSVNA